MIKNYAKLNTTLVQNLRKKIVEIKESEKKYRTLFESSSDAIMMIAPPSWRFVSGNPATIKMFKAKDEAEFTSKGPWELSPQYQPDGQLSTVKAKKMIMKAMKKGSNFFEWTHKRLNGEDFPATVLLTRMVLGNKILIQATVRDITEQKNAENALRESELRYKHLFDNIPFLSQSVTPDAKISYVNRTWKAVLGYSDKDIKKLKLWDIICKSEHEHCKKLFMRVMSGKPLKQVNTIFITKSGNEIPVEGAVMPIMEDGKVIATDAIFWAVKGGPGGTSFKKH